MHREIEKELRERLEAFPDYYQIKRFTLLDEPFSFEKDELTPTLKLKSHAILAKYQKEIEEMYR